MELSQPEISACEEQGTISLDIIRKGSLAESSYVTVKVYNPFLTEPNEHEP